MSESRRGPAARTRPREAIRDRMRASVLTAARELCVEVGWDQVRLTAVAERAGVSRPSVYSLFDGKPGLARSLGALESGRMVALAACVLREQSPAGTVPALSAAIEAVLAAGEANPFLRAALAEGPGRQGDLLRQLTADRDPLGAPAAPLPAALQPWARTNFPGAGAAELSQVTDAVVRLMISHLALPGGDRRTVADTLAGMAAGYLSALSALADPPVPRAVVLPAGDRSAASRAT